MNINDLMIGDWVLDGTQKAQVTSITFDGSIRTTADEDTNIEFIEPIPITTNILENNGFEYNKKETESMQNIYGYNAMLFNFPLGKGFYIEWNAEKNVGMITDHCFLKFKYVHELQHVLKMCGIKKEITL